MRVLGIDPGLTRCGFGVVDVAPDRSARLVAVGVIRTDSDAPIERRLVVIRAGIDELLDLHAPAAVAVERVFSQHNVRTVMGTAQAAGIAMERAAARAIPVGHHTPSEVKAAVTGYGSADKRQVAAMVQRILGLDAPPSPADAADALALALCHAWRGGPPAAAPGGPDGLTPAQAAWRAAERAARPTPPRGR
ncbi:MAG TPA: crossover junction endodeoxyribonuclease RuvC [Microbacteriaceae bacterium]|nr:crossover junction endodeoxyribonuclease RuvC [Microbacteriaceae bacterium]